jgi:hypothetical protein
MDLNAATSEPAAAALGKFLGFFQFDHAQDVSVEIPGLVFSSRRHDELDVIDCGEKRRLAFLETRERFAI